MTMKGTIIERRELVKQFDDKVAKKVKAAIAVDRDNAPRIDQGGTVKFANEYLQSREFLANVEEQQMPSVVANSDQVINAIRKAMQDYSRVKKAKWQRRHRDGRNGGTDSTQYFDVGEGKAVLNNNYIEKDGSEYMNNVDAILEKVRKGDVIESIDIDALFAEWEKLSDKVATSFSHETYNNYSNTWSSGGRSRR